MKNTCKIIMALFFILIFGGCTSHETPKTSQYREKVYQYGKKETWKEGIAYFQQEVVNNPKSAQAHCYLGISYIKEKNFDKAREELEEAVKIDPNYALAHAYLGWIYAEKHDYEMADESLKKAKQIDPQLSITYEIIGYVEKQRGNYDNAIQQLQEAQKKNYRESTNASMAELYFAKGDLETAKSTLQKTLDKNPLDYKALTSLGAIYVIEKKYNIAIELLERAKMIYADFAPNHLNLGVAYLMNKNPQDAQMELERAVALDRFNDNAHYYLGLAYREGKDLKKAEKELQQAISLNPDNEKARKALEDLRKTTK